jgi:radical SAM superfamily enzyme YgiQ (UPF0313 family)
LREAGFEPRIIDGAITPDFLNVIQRELDGCLAFGVSLLTGPMIRDAITASKLVRRLRPGLPIIYGGWHPSLMPAQTLRESFVDIVVMHQGEKTLVEVLQRLQSGAGLDMVAGCWFKNGQVYATPDRPASPLSSLPLPAYDMVDFEAYARLGGSRKLPYHQHRLSLRLQLLHRHGLLQSPLQPAGDGTHRGRSGRPGGAASLG